MQKAKNILLIFGVSILAGCSPGARTVPTISFSPKIPSSWTVEMSKPITSMTGKTIGSQLLLQNADKKRTMLVRACNTIDDLKSNGETWRQGELNSTAQSGGQVQKQEFSFTTTGGKETAQLQFLFIKSGTTFYFSGESWLQEKVFVTCDAMGETVAVADDKEIADVISSVVIK